MNPAVHQFLDASSTHLPEAERELLEERGGAGEGWPRVVPHEYGWWVNVQADEDYADETHAGLVDEAPALVAALKFAQTPECWWINFDSDASEIAGLEVYE